jgi:hypothetical protein
MLTEHRVHVTGYIRAGSEYVLQICNKNEENAEPSRDFGTLKAGLN